MAFSVLLHPPFHMQNNPQDYSFLVTNENTLGKSTYTTIKQFEYLSAAAFLTEALVSGDRQAPRSSSSVEQLVDIC